MSEPEAKLTAYEQRCRETCPWCAKGNTQDGHRHWSDGDWHKCTAPTESQFAEGMAQENARLKRDDQYVWDYLAKVTGHNTNPDPSDEFHNAVTVFGFAQTVVIERDQWREKFEQADKRGFELSAELEALREKFDQVTKPGKFRTGGKVKLNVYEDDRPIFQCHTPEEAERIVALLNFSEQLAQMSADLKIALSDIHGMQEQLAARDAEITIANRRAFEISLEKQMAVLNLDQAQQEIERLREALQPFAGLFTNYEGLKDHWVAQSSDFAVGDFKRVDAALAATERQSKSNSKEGKPSPV